MTINTTFTTTAANQEIMTATNIQNRLANALNMTTAEYANLLTNDGVKMKFVLFFSGTNTVTVNNSSYANSLIEDSVYASGEATNIKSIKVGTACTATISITLG